MSHFKDMHEEDIQRLLSGRASASDTGLEDVAGFVRALMAAYPEEPVSCSVENAHIAELVAAAQFLDQNGAPATPRRRLRPVRLALKLAAATVVFVMLFCGLAWAGTLPAPIQNLASRAASAIGVHIERPHVKPNTPAGGVASPTAKPSPTAKRGPTAKPSPTARPAKAGAAPSGQAGGQQQTQLEDQGDGHNQTQDPDQGGGRDAPQVQDGDQSDGQTQDPDQGGGRDEPQPEGDTQPQDQPGSGSWMVES